MAQNPQQSPNRPGTPPINITVEQPGGWWGRLGKLLLVLLIISVLMNIGMYGAYQEYMAPSDQLTEQRYSGKQWGANNKIAIISIEGAIMEGDPYVKRQIERVKEDPLVKAVVVRVNSPGGTVTQSHYIYDHLKDLREDRELPLVVSMGSICFSGGYYVAMAVGHEEDVIFAEEATKTGSIGVIIPHFDLTGLLESWKIKDDSILSHKFKDLGSMTSEMTDEERAILQQMVDESFKRFKEIVQTGRATFANDVDALDSVATGEIFSAPRAKKLGLIDEIGYIDAAIERAKELAHLDDQDVRVVEYQRKVPALVEALGGAQRPKVGLSNMSLNGLLDLTAPRDYYLATWLPALLKSRP